jgi:hypothetical protein
MSPSLVNTYKALVELGPRSVALNALYRFGLVSGHYRRVLDQALKKEDREWGLGNRRQGVSLFHIPQAEEALAVIGDAGKTQALQHADEIVKGQVRLFGAEPVELRLGVEGPLADWTEYETGRIDTRRFTSDIKFLWEPARFGWAFTLGRAYLLSRNEAYPETFWRNFETFEKLNPPYLGPQWLSGQEAALRLLAFAWAGQIFSASPASTPARQAALLHSIALHAGRIPPTLPYARSQRNNHLLTEAAGLFTAGLLLPDHPAAEKWRRLGWKELCHALPDQIDGYGEYSQHSSNYHRLMLQVVLWVSALIRRGGPGETYRWPRLAYQAIVRSVHWLLALLDPESGHVPNLGANDGAYILPLTMQPFEDFRPVLYAAARSFLDYDFPSGPWDELCLWQDIALKDKHYVPMARYLGDHLYGPHSWAYLRMAQFSNRPSHADQLHLDLWWRGLNVAQDAGTYLYNTDPPWDNSLTCAQVHNTVTVNGRDQMTRAGRFLYLDWLNAFRQGNPPAGEAVLQQVRGRIHNWWQSYRHTRSVTVFTDERWRIEDEMVRLRWLPIRSQFKPATVRLHWLLPDWEWQLEQQETGFCLHLKSPLGPLSLCVSASTERSTLASTATLVRAGTLLFGDPDPDKDVIRGWASPTYNLKVPALSFAIETVSVDDVQFISEFALS